MWIAVVPAYNEVFSIGTVIKNIFQAQVDLLILVANGCTDQTCAEALGATRGKKLKILHFSQPLGMDVPKAIGAASTLKYRPRGVLFVDGDMGGSLQPAILELIKAIESGLDLALTNCYPQSQQRSALAEQVLQARENLNRRLDLFTKLGVATPSHGPHAYSGSLLQEINLQYLAVPPKALVQAALLSAEIGIGATFPHSLLGSPPRSPLHSEKIAETIIGDCQEALELLNPALLRSNSESPPLTGYRNLRRFDILDQILKARGHTC